MKQFLNRPTVHVFLFCLEKRTSTDRPQGRSACSVTSFRRGPVLSPRLGISSVGLSPLDLSFRSHPRTFPSHPTRTL